MNITIGQYYPVDSYIHRLDSRIKLLSTIIYITSVFIINSIWGYLLSGLFLFFIVKISKVPLKLLFSGLKGIFMIIIFTVVLNIFFTAEGKILFQFHFIKITTGGIYLAIKMAVRLVLLIVGSSVLTLTTSPIQLTDAIEYLLKPFKKIGVPAHEIAMMMTIALRFIPTLIDELEKIKKAQMARGADFDTGGLIKKAKSLIPLLVPLFISSFRRADELALAMEARCYRGDINRTRMKKLILVKNDYTAISIMIIFLILILILRILINL